MRKIYRPSRGEDAKLVKQSRQAVARSFEILKQKPFDTFLGRKDQEPFTNDDEMSAPSKRRGARA